VLVCQPEPSGDQGGTRAGEVLDYEPSYLSSELIDDEHVMEPQGHSSSIGDGWQCANTGKDALLGGNR
jgi:hypothetical protein